jgi:hypothetical protein
MELIVIKNSELAEPYCYEYWDSERNTWVGIARNHDPEKIIPGYVCIDREGRVYLWDNDREIVIDTPPIDQNRWEDWARCLLTKDCPSARVIADYERKAVQILLPPNIYEKLVAFAKDSKRSITKMVEHIVEKYLRDRLFPED